MEKLVQVAVLSVPYIADIPYTYSVPSHLAGRVSRGDFVIVPFGPRNQWNVALVLKTEDADSAGSWKSVVEICTQESSFSEEMMKLCEYMKELTFCSFGEAVRTIRPSSAGYTVSELYQFNEEAPVSGSSANLADSEFFQFIRKKGKATIASLKTRFGAKETAKQLKSGLQKGVLIKTYQLQEPAISEPAQREVWISLQIDRRDAALLLDGERLRGMKRVLTPQQKRVLDILYNCDSAMKEDEVLQNSHVGKPTLKTLLLQGLLSAEYRKKEEQVRSYPKKEYLLNEEQNRAFRTLCSLKDTNDAKAALLYGVTGSGKTAVIVKTVDYVLEKGQGVIVLLPEIALTPQTLAIFCGRYGQTVEVIHSGLTPLERGKAFARIQTGEARVVIGTRSAVFAPVQSLGMIVMDEEQEHTYKSDNNPKYHARDIARMRCYENKALLVLASATPSVDSYKRAVEGKYTLISMNERFGQAVLPEVRIVDMRQEARKGNPSLISTTLLDAIVDTFHKKEQTILFLNRRGFNSIVSCRQCGNTLTCPHCSVSLTFHARRTTFEEGELVCHYCGYRSELPHVCPACGSEYLARVGYGTQRIEQEIGNVLPQARILRMDTDSTGSKSAYEQMLGKFRRHEADILLGTQMVTKGHDFPDVTLVGVLMADASMYVEDYRATEKTFSMITQVVGRAGRGEKQGTAILQTNYPDSPVIQMACRQDYPAFYQQEIAVRKKLTFPPFCDIVLLTLSEPDERDLLESAAKMRTFLEKLLKTADYSQMPLILYGPFEAPVYRLEGKYRMRFVMKCRINRQFRQFLTQIYKDYPSVVSKKTAFSLDINPSSI